MATGYWTPLWHMLVFTLGWSRPDRGLRWWIDAEMPTDGPALGLIRALWGRDGQLDWFLAWLCSGCTELPAPLGELMARPPTLEPPQVDDQWLRRVRENAEGFGGRTPLTGGCDPLHLSMHIDGPLARTVTRGRSLLRSGTHLRVATLLLDSTAGWYRNLIELALDLPDIGDRSWHVDVVARPVGWLGTYRRSWETGLWVTGRHSTHLAGN